MATCKTCGGAMLTEQPHRHPAPSATPDREPEWHQHGGWHHHDDPAHPEPDHHHGSCLAPDEEATPDGARDWPSIAAWWKAMAWESAAKAECLEIPSATPDRERLAALAAFDALAANYGYHDLSTEKGPMVGAWGEVRRRISAAAGVHPAAPSLDVEALIEAENRWREYVRSQPMRVFATRELCEFIAREYQRITGQ